jgi:ATP-binding cassette, subfamily B (MDR/TAP), member 1
VGRNIALGKGDAWDEVSREQILTAAQKAMLQAVLFEDLPNGVDTVVGDNGLAVSGGQRQRIALARALIRDPEVLILDESTSALDYISRSLVNDAIRLVRHGKTTIIITHDVSMINDMDFTYVMKDGQVVQNGFKKDLMQLESGRFFQMAKALERTPQAPASPVSPTFSPPAANFYGVNVRQSDGLWMSSRATVFGDGVSIAPRPLTMADGDLMAGLENDQFRRMKEAADSVAVRRAKSGRNIRAPALENVTESEYSMRSSTTTTEASRATAIASTHGKKHKQFKDVDNLSDKDIEAALEGKAVGSLKIWQMLLTAPKCLTHWQNGLMLIGLAACIGNGVATPAFGFTLSRLMANLFSAQDSSRVTLFWALSVLAVAAFDGITTFLKTYLLEISAEKWVYRTRKEAIKRILKQDCEWFLRNEGQPAIVASRLINGGEEMRPLLGRFAGNLLNAGTMLLIGVIAALIVGWELTLVGLALTPLLFFSTKAYVAICAKFSRNVTRQVERSTMVLHEVAKNIRAVVGLGLENYFEQKFRQEVAATSATATAKVLWIGTAFGILEGLGYFSKGIRLLMYLLILSSDLLVWNTLGV